MLEGSSAERINALIHCVLHEEPEPFTDRWYLLWARAKWYIEVAHQVNFK